MQIKILSLDWLKALTAVFAVIKALRAVLNYESNASSITLSVYKNILCIMYDMLDPGYL